LDCVAKWGLRVAGKFDEDRKRDGKIVMVSILCATILRFSQ
jgi:hypothetical protein